MSFMLCARLTMKDTAACPWGLLPSASRTHRPEPCTHKLVVARVGLIDKLTDRRRTTKNMRGHTMTLSFPPFTRWVKRLIISYAAVYLLLYIFEAFAPRAGLYFKAVLSL